MILQCSIVIWFGLLLLSCDRPDSTKSRNEEKSPNQPAPHRKHTQRESIPDRPAVLRAQLEDAITAESPTERDKALADVAWSAIETDPGLADEAFHRLPADSPEKIRLIQHFAMRLAGENPDDALEWADSLETELETSAAIGQIALTIAEADPLRAANLLSESGIAGRDFDVALVQVIQRWAAKSAPEAAAWVSLFPTSEARYAGIKAVAERWLPTDAPGAFAWLDGMKDAQLRNETARAMEGIILQQPAEIRDAWLQHANERIRNELEQQRDQAVEDVGDNIPPIGK